MEKFIFDLDYTLLIPDWSKEDDFFKENIDSKEFDKLMEKKQKVLNEYEDTFEKYELKTLSDFYKQNGIDLSEELIEKWMLYNGDNILDAFNEGAFELLEYLKSHNKKIVLLSNWFSTTQIMRLKKMGIYDYFDTIICGDSAMKPTKESFSLAVGDTPKEQCIMVGDDKRKDVEGAIKFGIQAYLLDKEHTLVDLLHLIERENQQSENFEFSCRGK